MSKDYNVSMNCLVYLTPKYDEGNVLAYTNTDDNGNFVFNNITDPDGDGLTLKINIWI